MMLVFFFKQKTAYEMRISDWSSDVCSSDLATGIQSTAVGYRSNAADLGTATGGYALASGVGASAYGYGSNTSGDYSVAVGGPGDIVLFQSGGGFPSGRSEEHTSELQSLMRISYAVFCLKQKNNT